MIHIVICESHQNHIGQRYNRKDDNSGQRQRKQQLMYFRIK